MRIYDYISDEELGTVLKALHDRPKCLSKAGMASKAATNDEDLTPANTTVYQINGIIYSQGTENIDVSGTTAGLAATAGGTGIQAAATYCAYLVTIIADTTWDVLKGDDATTAALALAALPAPAAASCPVAIMLVANTTNPFIVGTTKASASGVTVTFYDLYDIPAGYGEGAVYLDAVDE
jgi:hypothetical protein